MMKRMVATLSKDYVYGRCDILLTTHRSCIQQINVCKTHQQKGLGTYLLRFTEQCLYYKYNITSLHALVWQPQTEYVTDFYVKNNYERKMFTQHTDYYDDGMTVYELIPYSKSFTMDNIALPKCSPSQKDTPMNNYNEYQIDFKHYNL